MKKLASQFKALADETRLKILALLANQDLCVCEIIDELNMTQSAVSHHLKILKNADLVEDRREGKWIFYSLQEENIKELGEELLRQFVRPAGEREKSNGCTRDVTAICERIQAREKLGSDLK